MAKINRQELQDSFSFKAVKTLSVVMDKYLLDPILGFLFPSAGDLLTAVFSVPHFYISAVKIKSLPLTLAVLLNVLVDSLVGMIPFWIGDIIDVFNPLVYEKCAADCRFCGRKSGSHTRSEP